MIYIIFYFLLFSSTINASLLKEITYGKAIQATQQNNWKKAHQDMSALLIDMPDRADLLYDLGVTSFNNKTFDAASAYFNQAAKTAKSQQLKEQAWFNLGNTQVELEKLEDAIESYEQVLEINPNNEKAKDNIKIVKEMLREKEQQEQEKEQQKKKQDQEQQNQQNQPDTQPSNQNGNDKENNEKNDEQPSKEGQPENSQKNNNGEKNNEQEKSKEGAEPRDDRQQNGEKNSGNQEQSEEQGSDSNSSDNGDRGQHSNEELNNEKSNNNEDDRNKAHQNSPEVDQTSTNQCKDRKPGEKIQETQESDALNNDVQKQQPVDPQEQWVAYLLEQNEKSDKQANKQIVKAAINKKLAGTHGKQNW